MRGKLRDKRATKRDVFKREVVDRKRPARHDARFAIKDFYGMSMPGNMRRAITRR